MPMKRPNDETGPVKFTNKYLRSLEPNPEQKDCIKFDSECRGLGVRATVSGAKRFLVQWTDPVTKRKVREPIGAWGSITIEQARAAARARLGDVAKGIDPKSERKRRRAEAERELAERALTLEALLDEWSSMHLVRQSASYRVEAVRAIKRAFSGLLKRPAAQISKADAVNGVDRIVRAGTPVMAGRTLEYARAAFRWAEMRGKVPQNPFQNIPAVEGGKPARDRVLCKTELAAIWAAAGALRYPWGPFFRLALLTLQRRSEVGEMRWSELSKDLRIWDLSVKAGKPHVVHLPEAARAILKQLPRLGEFVLTNDGKRPVRPSTFHRGMLLETIDKLRRAPRPKNESSPAIKPWTVHDFRRTGVSKLAELGFDPIVADKILSHQPTKLRGVAAVYQRYDFAKERKAALAAWATYVTSIGEGARRGHRSQ